MCQCELLGLISRTGVPAYWRTCVLRLVETNQKSQIKIKRLNPLFHIVDQIKDNVLYLALLFHGGPIKITLTVPFILFFISCCCSCLWFE